MTLQNGLVHEGRAYLWTDTMLYDPETGADMGRAAKAFHGIAWPWAAVYSGLMDTSDLHKVARRVSEPWPLTGESLLKAAQDALRLEAEEGRQGRLLIAYPCSQYGARMFLIANEELPFAKAYEPHELGEYRSAGNGEPWAAEFAGEDLLSPADMRRFIDLQIENPAHTVHGWSGHTIGGNIVEIEISDERVECRVLRAVERDG